MIEELYATFYDGLLHYCASLARGDRGLGEDLLQETFLRAMVHAGAVDGLNRRQCWAWLKKTARNLYIDRVRKLSRETLVEREDLEQSGVDEDLTEVLVNQMVGRLPEEERTLFILRHFEGYNASELGHIFSLPPSTVRSRLASARRRLKQWLDTNQEG